MSKSKDRTKTKHPGIYYRVTNSGERRYQYHYSDEAGRPHFVTVDGGLQDAIAARNEVIARKRKGHNVAPNNVRFGEFARQWCDRQGGKTPSTIHQYEWAIGRHLKPLNPLRLRAIGDDEVADVIGRMRRANLSDASIYGVIKVLRLILEDALRRSLVPHNAVKRMASRDRPQLPPPRDVHLDPPEIRKLLEVARNTHGQGRSPGDRYRDYAILATAIFSGLRIGELCGLVWSDIDLTVGTIKPTHQMGDRGGRERVPRLKTNNSKRTIHVPDELLAILRELKMLSPYKADHEPVFAIFRSAWGGNHIAPNDCRRMFRRLAKNAGITKPGLVFHSLRHTFASMLISQGLNVTYVAAQLGDKEDTVLTTYAHVFDSQQHARVHRAGLSAEFGDALMESPVERGAAEVRQIGTPKRAA